MLTRTSTLNPRRVAGVLSLLLVSGCALEPHTVSVTPETPSQHNPVIDREGLADPAVILHEGTYYLYPTGDSRGFDVYLSRDLLHWEQGPRVLELDSPNVWAPDVFYDSRARRFYLYYSANYRIGVAAADSPTGPFNDRGILIHGAIDPHLFQDEEGSYYLYYEQLDDVRQTLMQGHIPTGSIYGQRMSDPLTPAGPPVLLLDPDESWEQGQLVIPGTISAPIRIVEGPWMLKRDDRYYLMYSGNSASSPDYAIGYATATDPLGPFEKADENPIAHRGEGVFGPGHHSVVATPEEALWMVYHQKASSQQAWDRYICIDRITWDGAGKIHVAPTPMRALATDP